MKKYYFIVFFALILFFCPRVNALSVNGYATVGRSAVMDTSYNYYYTEWKSLASNSLNIVPIPTSNGDYYQMGSEYAIAITLNGETSFSGSVRIPVASNTIYNYQLMNGLNENDIKIGIHQNFSNYNITPSNWSLNWSCMTYTHLGVAHNVCYYDYDFSFTLPEALTGSYNLNFAILNTTGTRSSYYYSGYDSNGNAIEFPVAASNTDYSSVAPIVRLRASSGSSESDNTEEILNGISQSTDILQQTIEESYEKLVKSQEVCNTLEINNSFITTEHCNLSSVNGQPSCTTNSSNWNYSYGVTDFIPVSSITILRSNYNRPLCFYDSNKSFISCSNVSSYSSLPEGTVYFRTDMQLTYSIAFIEVNSCINGNQALYDSLNEPFDTGIGATLFDGIDWYENSHFSSIITAPISFLNSLNDSCRSITLTYRGQNIVLPCGTTVFWERDLPYIATFRTFWNILLGGLIIYRLALALIMTVNDCLDPTKDKVGGFEI